MPYIVTTTNGTAIATVADNTVNTTTTSLALVGKNYAGYGSFLNENYVKLLENFSNSAAPTAPIKGQIWFDSAVNILKVYTGTQWKQVGTSTASPTAPSSPSIGDLWWDTANTVLKAWSGSTWVTIGPGTSTTGSGGSTTTGALVDTIVDTGALSHIVVKLSVSNTVICIISKDAAFTPLAAISGFPTINPGLNLISTSVLANAQFTGNAANSQLLNNLSSSAFLRTNLTQSTTGALSIVNNSGLTLGSSVTLTAAVVGGAFNLTNNTNNSDLNLFVNKGGVSTKGLGIQGSTGAIIVNSANGITAIINGGTNGVGNIGTSSQRFNTVHATTFSGKSTTAAYADLAERFESDEPLPAGTVVELGGVKEITKAVKELSNRVFGVISTQAAYLMNGLAGNNQTHPPVAMNGRVPVRVIGEVRKGDRLVSAGNGLARAASEDEITPYNVIGRALDDKYNREQGTVEAVVRINS